MTVATNTPKGRKPMPGTTVKTPKEVDTRVGQRVRARRIEIGMSQEALGEKLGLTFQQVQKYEKGTNRIGASRMSAIAETLGVSIAYLFGEGSKIAGTDDEVAAKLFGDKQHRIMVAEYLKATKPVQEAIVGLLIAFNAKGSR